MNPAAFHPCPTCGRPASRFLNMRELAGRFPKPDHDRVSDATLRARGRRIAADLCLRVIPVDGYEFVSEADVDALLVAVAA